MNYWLFKSEPDAFSVDDLARARRSTAPWDGVRNYQARNMMRDGMKVGDLGFFYHSSCEVPGVVGVVRIVRAGYPERAALNPKSRYFDAESDRSTPRWYCVDVCLERKIEPPITLEVLRKHAHGALAEMVLLRRGNRLSVMPVSAEEWHFIVSLA